MRKIAGLKVTVPFLVLVLALGQAQTPQAPTPVPESPDEAAKLLKYAGQLDAAAKKARAAGRQKAASSVRQPRTLIPDPSAEKLIQDRNKIDNGIYVDEPKVYDDSLLQQMINSAQNQLATMQGFDQSGLTRAIGNITGANQQIASFGISGGAQPAPIQTAYGNITSPFPVPPSTPPGPTTTLPSTQAPSASDILNEQLQITSQIQNLRLLLEGSLSDQIMVGRQETFAKPKVTLGFPVVISPENRYKDAVAVVEVFVETNAENDASVNGEAPSITALLPQEKSYNVAAISDKSAAIGLGFATATAGGSTGFLWGHKQYFIVKDQDTLAVQFEPTSAEIGLMASRTPIVERRMRAFAWQFRPVLGRAFVQAGSRQVFVQLAFPGHGLPQLVKSYGTVRVRTYWRRVNEKTGVLMGIIPESLRELSTPSPIINYDMRQQWGAVASFNAKTDMEDLGNGKMLIKLDGPLLPGTYLRVGSTFIQPGSAGVPSDIKTTRFVANISDLATLKTFVISRDGTEWQLKLKPGATNQFRVEQQQVTVTPLDDTNALLRVPISNFITTQDIPPVLLVGGKVYGYSDAPIDRNCNPAAARCVLSVALPKAVLAESPVISVMVLMLDQDGMQADLTANRTFTVHPQSMLQEKLALLSYDKDAVTYLVYGHDMNQATVLWPTRNADTKCPPDQACLRPVGPVPDDGTLKLLKLPLDFVKEANSVMLQRPGERPFVLAVPALPTDPASAAAAADAKAPKFQERVVVGENEGTIVGTDLDSTVSAAFGDKPLTIAKKTPTALKITGLAASGASGVAKTQQIVLTNQAGVQTSVPLEVVSSKVEVLTK